ncbi:MAG: F0F1 ATP synthase subunit gamma [Pseudomonadota bacterium]
MASGKEIRTKIKSVENTRKITRAMEMVAASKMKRAQERMKAARPYGEQIRSICAHIAYSNQEQFQHPFLEKRAEERIGLMLVTSDKGLCGGLNTNILRIVIQKLKNWKQQTVPVQVVTFGNKGYSFVSRLGERVVSHISGLGDKPNLEKLIGPIQIQINAYLNGEVDAVYIAYTKFINTMKQEPVLERLLPLDARDFALSDRAKSNQGWEYIYEPSAQVVIEEVLKRYVEHMVYQAVVENTASEQSARMVAMKAASDNAGSVINQLKLVYNKTRQAAITKELAEIVGGAAAV